MIPDVSIVIPVYNPGSHFIACLDSLVGQTMPHERFEVIAVDDGSTDGSDAVLDSYAAKFPDLFTVIHQENSGGPATPCNVGLRRARGRYVFFLGSDDYLGTQAVERMVGHADRLGSDVLAVKMIGVGGRGVRQLLFAKDAEDIPFPSRPLVLALSNTKLFSRALLTDHDIEYDLDLRVGSDQPFTINALLHAKKISAVTDGVYYYAVRRDDDTNLTYSSSWQTRLSSITAVMAHVVKLMPDPALHDQVLWRHFNSELSKLLRMGPPALDDAEVAELLDAISKVADEYLSPAILDDLALTKKLRIGLARSGDVAGIRRLEQLEEQQLPLTKDTDGFLIDTDALGLAPLERSYTSISDDHRAQSLPRALGHLEASLVASSLNLRFPCRLSPAFGADVRVTLRRPRPGGESRGPRTFASVPSRPNRTVPAGISEGFASSSHDLAGLRKLAGATWSLRCEVRTGDDVQSAPLMVEEETNLTFQDDAGNHVVRIWPDDSGRALLALDEDQ